MKRKIPLTEHLSVGFVRLSAGLTILFLFLILGYIMWNGFFYSYRRDSSVLSRAEKSVSGSVLVIDRAIPLSELPYDLFRNIFLDEYTTWKRLASKDVDLYPAIDESVLSRLASVLGREEAGALVEYPGDTEATVRYVSQTAGSAALVDAEAFSLLPSELSHRVKAVRVRPWALAVNPSVVELRGNMRIGTIEETDAGKLFRGEIVNWADLGGYDLPVVLVIPPGGTDERARIDGLGYKGGVEGAIITESLEEYEATLASVPGAAGIVNASRAESAGLASVRLARGESGRNLSLSFILEAPSDSGKIGGISTIIANTFAMILLTLLFSVPPGLFAAIYLVEYAREGRLVRIIRLGVETLAGIPSIIFGLFGMLVFVQGFKWGISLLSGSLTVTLMILPTIVRTAEEALKSVPKTLQEGSLALGATKVQTIFRVVLPTAFPAIASGIILATGRALGETAALLYTMGSNYNLTSGLLDSTRTLAVHIYLIIAEGISSERAFASGTILIFFILIINTSARAIINRFGRMTRA